jgi:hypothetical protein
MGFTKGVYHESKLGVLGLEVYLPVPDDFVDYVLPVRQGLQGILYCY